MPPENCDIETSVPRHNPYDRQVPTGFLRCPLPQYAEKAVAGRCAVAKA